MSQPSFSDEFMELVTQHQSRLYGYIFAIVRNAEDADDLFQQTVLVMWRKFDSFDRDSDFARWAWATAKYEVRNFQRTSGRRRVFCSEESVDQIIDTAQESAAASDDTRAAALKKCIGKLAQADRHLLKQSYFGGRKIKDVANELGRSSQSVCNSLSRIRTALFNCIQSALGQEGKR